MAIVNLLEETIEKLERCGLTTADVKWVGWSNGWQMTDWQTFINHANQEYDNEAENWQVHHNLVVVGEDWWLERNRIQDEDTKSKQEQWIYFSIPKQMKKENRSKFFFAFEDQEVIGSNNPAYKEDLLKFQRLLRARGMLD